MWPNGKTINDVDSTPKALASYVFNNKLYVFWKANDSGNGIYYSASSDGVTWPNGNKINNFDSTPEAISACFFECKFYLFWKANDQGDKIFYSMNEGI